MKHIMKRRAATSGTARCIDPYVGDIKKVRGIPCDGSSGDCVWKGFFEATVYNVDPKTVTFDWSVDTGTTPNGHTGKDVEVWIRASINTVFKVTCVITDNGMTSSITKEFESRNEP